MVGALLDAATANGHHLTLTVVPTDRHPGILRRLARHAAKGRLGVSSSEQLDPLTSSAMLSPDGGCNTCLQLLQALQLQGVGLGQEVSAQALRWSAAHGHAALARHLLERGTEASDGAAYEAACCGYTGVLELLLDAGAPVTRDLVTGAIWGLHLGALAALLRHGPLPAEHGSQRLPVRQGSPGWTCPALLLLAARKVCYLPLQRHVGLLSLGAM